MFWVQSRPLSASGDLDADDLDARGVTAGHDSELLALPPCLIGSAFIVNIDQRTFTGATSLLHNPQLAGRRDRGMDTAGTADFGDGRDRPASWKLPRSPPTSSDSLSNVSQPSALGNRKALNGGRPFGPPRSAANSDSRDERTSPSHRPCAPGLLGWRLSSVGHSHELPP
jgi:hypothetical protein